MLGEGGQDRKSSQEILVAFWGVLMGVLVVMLGFVLYVHHKSKQQLKKKLYNFKKAPKNYVDDDSFINLREP
jgi:hypothetical protein